MEILNFMAVSFVVENQNEYDELLKNNEKDKTVFSCTLSLENRLSIQVDAWFGVKEIRLESIILQYKMSRYLSENKKFIVPPALLEDFSREVLIFASQCVVDASKCWRSIDFFEDLEK
jgi:hypothetical protein